MAADASNMPLCNLQNPGYGSLKFSEIAKLSCHVSWVCFPLTLCIHFGHWCIICSYSSHSWPINHTQ